MLVYYFLFKIRFEVKVVFNILNFVLLIFFMLLVYLGISVCKIIFFCIYFYLFLL